MSEPQIRVLCVDDDVGQLEALDRVLRRRFQVVTCTAPVEALHAVATEGPFGVVVCDFEMPDMNGVAFLTEVRQTASDIVRLLLTGKADLTDAIAAVNEGHIFRFLRKPCPPAVIVKAVEAAAAQHDLIVSERVLLEQTLRGSIAALVDVLALAQPSTFGRVDRLKRLVSHLADVMPVPNRWEVEVAAMLAEVGTIGFPPDLIEKLATGAPLTESEARLANDRTAISARIIGSIPRLEGVRQILEGLGGHLKSGHHIDSQNRPPRAYDRDW